MSVFNNYQRREIIELVNNHLVELGLYEPKIEEIQAEVFPEQQEGDSNVSGED